MPDKKVVNTFQQRRQLTQAIDALAAAANEAVMIDMAYQIVDAFPADLVLATLIKRLETADSKLRGGLGHVAALLPEAETAAALRAAAADRHGLPQKRVAAALILERYLEQTLPPGMMNDLDDSNEVAFQSLLEAIESGKHDRLVLLEYVTQMRQTEPMVASMVMDMLARVEPADRVDLLRLIAQDARPSVTEDALLRLEALAKTDGAVPALRALHTLQFVLPANNADWIKRTLRKLQFSGASYQPGQPDGWQSLVTPSGPAGYQTVWLIQHPQNGAKTGKILGFVLNWRTGIRQMFGNEEMPRKHLLAAQPLGRVDSVDVGGGHPLNMLATPFDYGRWLVLQASAPHRLGPQGLPLPEDYQLYNDLLWQYSAPVVDAQAAAYFGEAGGAGDTSAARVEDVEDLAEMAASLLALPAMDDWTRQNMMLVQATEALGQEVGKLPRDFVVQHILREIGALAESAALIQAFEDGLRAQAAWLHFAGDEQNARNAYLLAANMQGTSIGDNPMLAQLIRASLAQMLGDG